jgi:hypothetical protein
LIPSFRDPKDGKSSGVWNKIVFLNQTLQSGKYDWVLWMDFDTLFTDMRSTIEDFMDECKMDIETSGGDRLWTDINIIAAPDWYVILHSN